MLNIIIYGAPGSGKGTQSDLILDKYNLIHLSTGDLLRKEIETKTERGLIADSYISNGNLVPDSMMIEMLVKYIIDQPEECNGIILDGFPRTVDQAEALEALLNNLNKKITVLIELKVDNDELINRLLLRGKTSGRSDDNLETIKKRLIVYNTKTAPVSDYYKKIDKYAAINGMGTVEEIFSNIVDVIDFKIKNEVNSKLLVETKY
jgi:adenylate kinase